MLLLLVRGLGDVAQVVRSTKNKTLFSQLGTSTPSHPPQRPSSASRVADRKAIVPSIVPHLLGLVGDVLGQL